MYRYVYRIYYKFIGPTIKDPLGLNLKVDHEIKYELDKFPEWLSLNLKLSDQLSHVEALSMPEKQHSILVTIKTPIIPNTVKEILERCLQETPLFAEEIKQG
jgi:hypothetical protein